jgi:hypothetical protein
VHICKAPAKIRQHVQPTHLGCIHDGIVRLIRLHGRSSRNAGAGDEHSAIETERGLPGIGSPHDRRSVRSVGNASGAQTRRVNGVGSLGLSAAGGGKDLGIGTDTDDRERFDAGEMDVAGVAGERSVQHLDRYRSCC